MAPDWSARFGCREGKGVDMTEELEAKLLSFLSRASLLFCPLVGLEKIFLGVVRTSFSDTLTLSLSLSPPPDWSLSGPGNLMGGLGPFLACKASWSSRELRGGGGGGGGWERNSEESWPGPEDGGDKRCWLLNLSFSSSINRPKWLANL